MDKPVPEPCRTCAHCVPDSDQPDSEGACHYAPPRAVPLPAQHSISGAMGMQVIAVWPPVKLAEPGCGQHTTTEQRLADDIRRRMVRLDPETGELSGLAQ